MEAHGHVRVDDWYWFGDRDDPGVLPHLKAENAYADAVLAPTGELQEVLYAGIRDRVQETDTSAPYRHGGFWWYTRTVEGQQYGIFCRRRDPDGRFDAAAISSMRPEGAVPEQVVLDENLLADDSEYFSLGVLDLSPDFGVLAYAADLDGSERYTLRFRQLETGEDLPDIVDGVTYGSAWAADNRTFFYVRPDDAMRPYQVWRHTLGTDATGDQLVFEEPDERYFVSVGATRSERYILIGAESKTTSEIRFVEATRPDDEPTVVWPRRRDVEYDVEDAGDGTWLIRTNRDGATNFVLLRVPVDRPDGPAETVLAHRDGVRLESVDAFADHFLVVERSAGLSRLRIIDRAAAPGDLGHVVEQPEPVYTLGLGPNPEWDAHRFRYVYTSLTRPATDIDYDPGIKRGDIVRQTPVRGHFDPDDWRSERLWATAADGTQVPISLVAPKGHPKDGSGALLLYGYGAYEISIDPTFSIPRLNLLERGMAFAIAHVRGGGEMGREWYEQGRLQHKANTFTDFVACAEHLITDGWTNPDRLVIRGGSAGGLLMGAVTNLRPDLWRAVVAEVPFVDVVTTMSDPSLPLTVTEYDEWGNPTDDEQAYWTMLSYSPYDNVTSAAYPALYATGGLNDPRVGYWEPAKWVAKLRDRRTDDRVTVLRTELGAGHGGPSGRYDAWRDEARVQAFVLTEAGLSDAALAGPE